MATLVHHTAAMQRGSFGDKDTTSASEALLPSAAAMAEPVKQPIASRVPSGSWDSHMHVVDLAHFPLAPTAPYTPGSHSLDDARLFEATVGIENIVLVQPSFYGNDNSCILDVLRRLGPRRARAVVAFDPATTPLAQLREWHALGVRGVRLNYHSNGVPDDNQVLEAMLHQYADAIRPLGWVLQVYVPMALIEALEAIVPTLDVRFCIDHLGQPALSEMHTGDPYEIRGFRSLVNLLQQGRTFVKLSAPYRMSKLPGHTDLEPVAREIIRLKGMSRVVFATDWPHTRYEGQVDILPWMETVLDWCDGDDALREHLFKKNAEELWDITDE